MKDGVPDAGNVVPCTEEDAKRRQQRDLIHDLKSNWKSGFGSSLVPYNCFLVSVNAVHLFSNSN